MLAGSAMLGAAAIVISVLKIEVPYPILPYLMFDLAEAPDFLSYLLFGVWGGLITSTAHFIVLMSRNPVGAPMKYIAVISMIIGFHLASKLAGGMKSKGLLIGIVGGILVRVLVMTFINVLYLWVLFRGFIDYASGYLSVWGFSTSNELDVLILTLIFTAIYNTIHTIFTIIASYIPYRMINRGI